MKNKLDWVWFNKTLCDFNGKLFYLRDNLSENLLIEAMVRGFYPSDIASRKRLNNEEFAEQLIELKQLAKQDKRWQIILEKVASKR